MSIKSKRRAKIPAPARESTNPPHQVQVALAAAMNKSLRVQAWVNALCKSIIVAEARATGESEAQYLERAIYLTARTPESLKLLRQIVNLPAMRLTGELLAKLDAAP
jgi:hypothetical protein